MTTPRRQWVEGCTIVRFDLNPAPDGRGGTIHDPVIVLDNGARLVFVGRDTDDDNRVVVRYIKATGRRHE